MNTTLTRLIEVEKSYGRNSRLVVNVCFVGGADAVLAAEVVGVSEQGLIVSDNGHTKLIVLSNATTVEFINVPKVA